MRHRASPLAPLHQSRRGVRHRLAGEAGVAVESARAIDRLDTRNRELRLLLETGAAIASSVDLRTTLATINERLVQTLGVAWSDVYDYHADSDELQVISYFQVPGVPLDAEWLGRRFTAESWPDGLAAVRTRRAQTMYYDYSRLSFEDFAGMETWGEKATLTVPLVYGDEVFGVLDVAESRYPRRFTPDEISLAEAIGAQAAVAIHNARAFEETEASQRRARHAPRRRGDAELDGRPARRAGRHHATPARGLGSTSAEVYDYDAERRSMKLVAYDSDTPLDVEDWSGVYELRDDPLRARCIDEPRGGRRATHRPRPAGSRS